jgi:acetyltransferase-like isoleucine patch superfamily enzyme
MRQSLKKTANGLAFLLIFPAVVCYWVASLFLGRNQAYPGWAQALSLLPGLTGVYLRRAFYRLVLASCSPDACLSFGTVISHRQARIGRGVFTGLYCTLGKTTLEEDVLIASHVSITSGGREHGIERLDLPIRLQPGEFVQVTIGRDTWIGERAVVMADVGAHCVIGAGAVVTKPLPDFSIAAGVPARVIGRRTPQGPVMLSRGYSEEPGIRLSY